MKFLRKIFLIVFIIIAIILAYLFFIGQSLYKEKIRQIGIDEKINKIRNDENFTSLSDVPEFYKNAVVSVEDHRFYKHGAVDFIALLRATVSNISQKEFKEGGSSITQQTAKNLYFMEEDNVVARKSAEIIMSYELEKIYSKDEILEIYINTIYFGNGYYGIKEACEGYLQKEPKDMNISEATMLAGVPNAPSLYNPKENLNLTQSRQKKVIRTMVENNYITQKEADDIEIYNQ